MTLALEGSRQDHTTFRLAERARAPRVDVTARSVAKRTAYADLWTRGRPRRVPLPATRAIRKTAAVNGRCARSGRLPQLHYSVSLSAQNLRAGQGNRKR